MFSTDEEFRLLLDAIAKNAEAINRSGTWNEGAQWALQHVWERSPVNDAPKVIIHDLNRAERVFGPTTEPVRIDNSYEQMQPNINGNLCGNCGHDFYYHSKGKTCHVSYGRFNDGNRCHNSSPYTCVKFQPTTDSGEAQPPSRCSPCGAITDLSTHVCEDRSLDPSERCCYVYDDPGQSGYPCDLKRGSHDNVGHSFRTTTDTE